MTTSQQLLYSVNREGANYPSPTLINVQQYIFSPQLTKCEAHASVVVMDSSPQWRHRPVITLRIRDIQEIGCLSSYTPELLALTMALWIKIASHLPSSIYTDSESSLDTIANRRNHLKSAKTSCHILLRRADYLLQYSHCPLHHVSSHADKYKNLQDLTYPEWGNFIADKVAVKQLRGAGRARLHAHFHRHFCTQCYPGHSLLQLLVWRGDAAGIPLPLVPLSSQLNDVRHQLYITDRDN